MQIEVDVEGLISRSIADGILNSHNIQKEVDKILKSDEYQKILNRNIKTRLDEILLSEDGKKRMDESIIDEIAKSDNIQDEIEKILDSDEYHEMLQQHAKVCLQEVILSEEGKKQILDKVKEYLESYEIEYNDDFDTELSKGISDVLLIMIKDAFERLSLKASNM